jgi:hypothetical protein
LIALAMLCGIAILVAGGVWLVTADRGGEAALSIGRVATVGEVSAAVLGATFEPDGRLALDVEMGAPEAAVGDPAQGWAVISSRGLVERVDASDAPDACAGRDVAAGESLRCTVTFAPTAEQAPGPLVAVYGRGEDRASWSLPSAPG